MAKKYKFDLVIVHNGSKDIYKHSEVDAEDLAIKEYFVLEHKQKLLKIDRPTDEIDLFFEVNNLDDPSLDNYEKYNFFSIIQGIKAKQRLPLNLDI